MYNDITTHDLDIRVQWINEQCNTTFHLEHRSHVVNPYRLMDSGSIVHSGTKKELYRYLIGVLEGINTYKQAHNLR